MKFSPTSIKVARRTLLGAAGCATLLALFVTIENVRGDRAWQATAAALKSSGAPLDVAELRRVPIVPSDQNLFETPLVATLLFPDKPSAPARAKLLEDTKVAKLGLSLIGGKGRDLGQLRQQLENLKVLAGPSSDDPAIDIRAALKPADTVLDELRRAALEHPEGQLPVWVPTDEVQPTRDFSALSQIGGALLLRASADVALGRSDQAIADIATVFQLADGLSRPPTNLLQCIIAQRWRALATIPLREGMRRHAWSEAQLIQLQALWTGRYSAIARLRAAHETEQVWTLAYLDGIHRYRFGRFRPWWAFHGWIQQSKVSYVEFTEALFSALDVRQDRILPERLKEMDRTLNVQQQSHIPYIWFVHQFGGSYYSLISKVGEAENSVRLAASAIALERHRLAAGGYPESLEQLGPNFLSVVPVDIFTGKPFDYTHSQQGGYVLKVGPGRDPTPETSWTQAN